MADNPITRKEKYLAKLTGSYTGNVPDPITRVEKYLYDLCQKGISGPTPEEIENAVNKYLEGKDYVTKMDADKAYQPAGSYLSGTDEGLAVSGKAADAKAVGNAVAKIEGINYTDRGTLADTDAFLINDGTGMKKSVLSKLSDFVLNKIADKVFAKLQTNNKTILGAINELNSKAGTIYSKGIANYGAAYDAVVIHSPDISVRELGLFVMLAGSESDQFGAFIYGVSDNEVKRTEIMNNGNVSVTGDLTGNSITIKIGNWGRGVVFSYARFDIEIKKL